MKVAIYSRKSKFTGKGESIQNQIEICKDYLNTHFDIKQFTIYEDEGFSGGNTDRPEFQRMIQDAKLKKFDMLICYRLDRISRNISDFSNLITLVNEKSINFVSVREQFDTTTPMGRAMMYIASVFAQLERETIAERIKDNMHQLARSGRWLGGTYPTGFQSEPIMYLDSNMKEKKMYKLIPVPEELEIIKIIYEKYIELASLSKLETYCLQNKIKTTNGKDYQKQTLKFILINPVYAIADQDIYEFFNSQNADICNTKEDFDGKHGVTGYNKRETVNNRLRKFNDMSDWIVAVGKHKGIISGKDWIRVQQTFEKNRNKFPRHSTSGAALLSGLMRCSICGSFIRVLYGDRKPNSDERYKYYICNMKIISNNSRCNSKRINIEKADQWVIDALKNSITKYLFEKTQQAKKKQKNSGTKRKEIALTIEKNSKAIDNLVKQLSLNQESLAAEFLIKEIERLGQENKNLNQKLQEDRSDIDAFNLEILEDHVIQFNEKIDTADFDEKRRLVHGIISRIEWDGENLDIRTFELD